MRIIFTVLFALLSSIVIAQPSYSVVEQFAREDEGATARSMGVAGAFGAVGADFSSATNNPAGMAFFRKKELGLGLGYQDRTVETDYLNTVTSQQKSVLRLQNVGFVYSDLQTEWIGDSLAVKRKGVVSWSIGLGMNQKADFDEEIRYGGVNQNNSITRSLVAEANAAQLTDLSNLPFYANQAYQVGLIEPELQNNGYYRFSSPVMVGMEQEGMINRKGARRDYYVSGGVNVENKLYVGATINIPSISYEENIVYTETDKANLYADFNSLEQREGRDFSGTGANLGIGAIYRFSDYIRAGVKVKTPTVIELTQDSEYSTTSDFGTSRNVNSTYKDEYNITLPWNAGVQFVASHPAYGLLSLEADYVDYSNSKIKYLNDDYGDFDEYEDVFEDDVDYFYRGAFNLRGGVEARVKKNFRLRGGVAYNMRPYEFKEDTYGADYSKLTLGLGAGYRHEPANLTFDLGTNHISTNEFNYNYLISEIPNTAISDKETFVVRLNVSKRFNQ